MILIYILLGVFILFLLTTVITLWKIAAEYRTAYINDHPEILVNDYFNKVDKKYPCTLLLSKNYNADFDGTIYDFSAYEEKNIIGLTICCKQDNDNDDETATHIILPKQMVYLMKDGSYQWDFRQFWE